MTIKVESASNPEPVVAKSEPVKEVVESAASVEAAETEISDASEASEEEPKEDGEEIAKDSEEEESEEKEESKDEAKKPLKGFKKRIDKLSKARAEAERERDYWRDQAMNGPKQKESVEATIEPKLEGEPDPDDFESHRDYVKAVVKWDRETSDKENTTKQNDSDARASEEKKVVSFKEKSKALREKHEDFDDVMESVSHIDLGSALRMLLLNSENGHEIGYHLAKNEAELERIAKLDPLAAAVAFGEFKSGLKISKAQETNESKTTKAPAPISPVGSKGSAPSSKTLHEVAKTGNQSEYEAFRAKQLSAKGA